MNINWQAVLTGSITFIVLNVLKILLDMKVLQFFVKYFHWIPVRNFLREKPKSISGRWEQTWESADSKKFKDPTDRHSHPDIKQWASYCYAEFISKGITYVFFGRVIDNYVVGDWYDKNDPSGYFGAFQLEIMDSDNMQGRWIGHSKSLHTIKSEEWKWNRILSR